MINDSHLVSCHSGSSDNFQMIEVSNGKQIIKSIHYKQFVRVG